MNTTTEILQHSSAGKWILSGEHANVYGAPTIASTIDRCFTITTKICAQPEFTLPNIDNTATATFTADEAISHYLISKAKHAQYLNGECPIQHIISHPYGLMLATLGYILYKYNSAPNLGASFQVTSNIPSGCGLGSSAACILTMLQALNSLYNLQLTNDDYLEIGRNLENLQHGQSSGNDLRIIQHGGLMHIQGSKITALTTPAWHWYLLDSGQPNSSTGECVQHAQKYFKAKPQLIKSFKECTQQLLQAIQQQNIEAAMLAIANNQNLLQAIGVAPQPLCADIEKFKKLGIASKITGSGCIKGPHAGSILLLSKNVISEKIPGLTKINIANTTEVDPA